MIWRLGGLLGLLCACELLEPPPHDTGPLYANVQPPVASGSSSGAAGTSSATTQAGTSTPGPTSHATSNGPVCPEWCAQARGYHCDTGECILNGSSGPIQVTLEWHENNPRAREDLDLHLVDPTGCEMYFGHKDCASGSLDLDQNASCANTDNVGGAGNDTENIIFTPNTDPPHGNYEVWVVDWSDSCDGDTPNPFFYTVTVRYHGQTHIFHGQFNQGSGVGLGAVAGMQPNNGAVLIHSFTY
jgi:hypothetical protein